MTKYLHGNNLGLNFDELEFYDAFVLRLPDMVIKKAEFLIQRAIHLT